MKTILLSTDFSKASYFAINCVAKIAKVTNSRLVLFNVCDELATEHNIEKNCQENLEKIVERLSKKHGKMLKIDYKCSCITNQEQIQHFAQQNNIDIIIKGAPDIGFISAQVIDHISASITKYAPCPVLSFDVNIILRAVKNLMSDDDYHQMYLIL